MSPAAALIPNRSMSQGREVSGPRLKSPYMMKTATVTLLPPIGGGADPRDLLRMAVQTGTPEVLSEMGTLQAWLNPTTARAERLMNWAPVAERAQQIQTAINAEAWDQLGLGSGSD